MIILFKIRCNEKKTIVNKTKVKIKKLDLKEC